MENWEEALERLNENYQTLLFDLDPTVVMRQFKKNKYENFMTQYCEKHQAIYQDLKLVYDSCEDYEKLLIEPAKRMAQKGKQRIDGTFFIKREREQMDLNCVLAFFVFPGLLELNEEKAHKVAEITAGEWKKAFPKTDLGIASKDEILSGFRKKIFGVPIE